MSEVRITMTVDIPVDAEASEADAEEMAVYLLTSTGTGNEPVYTEVEQVRHNDQYMRLTLTAEPDKLLLIMARLSTLWARWHDADGRLIPDGP